MEPGRIIPTPETATNVGPEVVASSEIVSSIPQPQPLVQNDNQDNLVPAAIVEPAVIESAQAEEVAIINDMEIETADRDWIGKVKEVIREDKSLPFKEETDAEKLNEDYMKKRFNIDVDAPIEEK